MQGCGRPWFCLNPNACVLTPHLITSKANHSRKVRFVGFVFFFFGNVPSPAWIIGGFGWVFLVQFKEIRKLFAYLSGVKKHHQEV